MDMTQIIIALIVALPGIIAAWKSHRTSVKVDEASAKLSENTEMTEKTKTAVGAVGKQLNGAMDERIRAVVKQEVADLHNVMTEHSAQDEKNMQEIREVMAEMKGGK